MQTPAVTIPPMSSPVNRRHFLSSSLAVAALPLLTEHSAAQPVEHSAPQSATQSAPHPAAHPATSNTAPEFYALRRYQLISGPQLKLTEAFFADALIPALNRLGLSSVGAFSLDFGPDTPAYYLLIPGPLR